MNANDDELLRYGITIAMFAAFYAVRFCFLLTIMRGLQRIHPDNRLMQPMMVWLDLIPLFNWVWGFIIVNRVADSLDREFYDLRLDRDGEDYGRAIGIAGSVCTALWCFTSGLSSIPAAVCMIIYWSRIHGYSKFLAAQGGDDFDDFDQGESQ